MLDAFIPYFDAPERTLIEHVPLIGPLKLQLFGPLVATGVIIGWYRSVAYANKKDIDQFLFKDYLFWMLVSAFVISHLVSVIFYFPHQIAEDPIVLLQVWNGLSSVGGFFGAYIGMMVYLRVIHKQPVIVFADATIYGLLIGWCFGRAGCSVVHDHPGIIVEPGTFLAVGPWPDGQWRYDLGLLEFMFAVTITTIIYLFVNVHERKPGWLVGFVVVLYAPFRFAMDFLRAHEPARGIISTPDARYAGLTTAQWFTILFLFAGIYMLMRKPKESDFAYAKESDRFKREAEQASEGSPEDDHDDDGGD
jgi:phosphatidylglycerol---prolipoprotein diacylglyceryl transferase